MNDKNLQGEKKAQYLLIILLIVHSPHTGYPKIISSQIHILINLLAFIENLCSML